jgi:hypothetical protein
MCLGTNNQDPWKETHCNVSLHYTPHCKSESLVQEPMGVNGRLLRSSPAEQGCKDLSRAHRQREPYRQREYEQVGVAAWVTLLAILAEQCRKDLSCKYGRVAKPPSKAPTTKHN